MQYRGIIGAALAAAIVASPAFAGPLGPKKPSQIVTLRCFEGLGDSCVISNTTGGPTNPDGTFALTGYTIPAGMVLVITSIAAQLGGGTPFGQVFFKVTIGLGVGHHLSGAYDVFGNFSVTKEFPTGIVVNPAGLAFGIGARDYVADADYVDLVVNGYLTTDK